LTKKENGGSKMEKETERKMIKILEVLAKAGCFCPLGYISLHTNIVEPQKILNVLKEKGYVVCCTWNGWSPSNYPQFMITPNAIQELRRLEAEMIKIPKNFILEG